MAPTFRRLVKFERGYNYLHETGPSRRGQHGMGIRFVLVGPDGAAQFLMNTGWTPLGEVDRHLHQGLRVVRHPNPGSDHMFPSGYDLGYHWRTPLYEDHGEYGPCEFTGARCYYDGSGLAGDEVLRDFISEGERAVWRWLVKRYRWCLESAAEMAGTAS